MSGRDRLRTYKKSGKTDENRRRERATKLQMQRNASRGDDLARRRGLEEEKEVVPQQPVQVIDPVRVKLAEWKKKKEEKLRQQKRIVKPAFKVGIVKHDDKYLYRPTGESKMFQPPQNLKPLSVQRPVTRTLRSGNQYLQDSSTKPSIPTVAQALNDFAAALKPVPEEESDSEMNRTFDLDSENKELIAVEGNDLRESVRNTFIPKPEEAINFAKDELILMDGEIDSHSDQEAPAVTDQMREFIKSIPEAIREGTMECTDENVLQQSSSQAEKQYDAQYFRSLHGLTVSTLEQFCEKWMLLKEQEMPTHIQDLVDVAVGYTRLFIKEKLLQFDELISDHLNVNTKPPVLIEDLEGFWSLVDIQVQDVHKKFANLDTLQKNDWQEPMPEPQLRTQKGKSKKKAPVGKGKSNARAFIELARKQMKPHNVSSPKPMSPAVMRVSLMAKNIAVTPPKRDSMGPVTPQSKSRPRSKKPEKENVQPANCFPEIGQCLKPAKTPARDSAFAKATVMATGGDHGTPLLTPRRSKKIVMKTPNSSVRRSTRLLNKGKDVSSDLISWNSPS